MMAYRGDSKESEQRRTSSASFEHKVNNKQASFNGILCKVGDVCIPRSASWLPPSGEVSFYLVLLLKVGEIFV